MSASDYEWTSVGIVHTDDEHAVRGQGKGDCTSAVTVCRYSREADWEYIAKCASAAAPLPLVGNGDIFAWTDYDAHIQQIPELATTMIARGALIKPWIFTEVCPLSHGASINRYLGTSRENCNQYGWS